MQVIIESGYTQRVGPLSNHETVSQLPVYNTYYKRINNPLVLCEENGNGISFKIVEYAPYAFQAPQYELEICFCRKKVWYNLKAYSVNKKDLTKKKIKELEQSLVKMFLGI